MGSSQKENDVFNISKINSDVKKTVITVDVNGINKSLMRFEIRPSGDVVHLLKHASHFRLEGVPEHSDKEIKQQRYSFHRSLNSSENINVIKQTYEFKSGEVMNSRLVTPAIKNKSGFVQVYSRRVQNLTSERYDTKKHSKGTVEESLGEWEMKNSNLFLSVFVGSASLNANYMDDIVNVRSFVMGDFRFVIAWTYLIMPALGSGTYQHNITTNPNDDMVICPEVGHDMKGVINQAMGSFWSLVDEFATTLSAQEGFRIEILMKLIELTGFIKNGCRHSKEHHELRKRMIASGDDIKFKHFLGQLDDK